ncbi:MAG: hypothetical protein R6X06_05385 [Gammaproteobacteria bacterium]
MARIHKRPVNGTKALEMNMRDVMDGLYDSACYFAFRSTPDTLEILSIEPPKGDPVALPRKKARVHHMPINRTANVVDFLMAREEEQLRIGA